MARKVTGVILTGTGKEKKSGGVVVAILIGVAYLYFYNGFLDWWYEKSPPARYVEQQDR